MSGADLRERLAQSDMVLVGLGEEFDLEKQLGADPSWESGKKRICDAGLDWLLPAWNSRCSAKMGDEVTGAALRKLLNLLKDKNYFCISVSTNELVRKVIGTDRLVMPCGGSWIKQCSRGCEEELYPVAEEDRQQMDLFLDRIYENGKIATEPEDVSPMTKMRCSRCGAEMVLNNIYCEHYNERGYLDEWGTYTKWLQGTLHRRLLVLELGVGMKFPTVIRWPFEKAVLYNQKAFLVRVNERLYQIPEELSTKGFGISKNSIDWLGQLC